LLTDQLVVVYVRYIKLAGTGETLGWEKLLAIWKRQNGGKEGGWCAGRQRVPFVSNAPAAWGISGKNAVLSMTVVELEFGCTTSLAS